MAIFNSKPITPDMEPYVNLTDTEEQPVLMPGFEHQCSTPLIWWARLRRSKLGRTWTCRRCGTTWGLHRVPFPGNPFAPRILEWNPYRKDNA